MKEQEEDYIKSGKENGFSGRGPGMTGFWGVIGFGGSTHRIFGSPGHPPELQYFVMCRFLSCRSALRFAPSFWRGSK